jgi:hypothetical protein
MQSDVSATREPVDSSIKIIPRPKRERGRPRKRTFVAGLPVTTIAKSLPGKATIVPSSEEDEEAAESRRPYLTIGLLASANRKPHFVRATDDVKTAVTLLLMHKISHVPVMQSERSAMRCRVAETSGELPTSCAEFEAVFGRWKHFSTSFFGCKAKG